MRDIMFQVFAAVVDVSRLPRATADDKKLQAIVNTVFAVLGAVVFLVITLAGLRYVLSRGDPGAIAQAKNTIIYALVGLVVALAAFGIVSFVISGV